MKKTKSVLRMSIIAFAMAFVSMATFAQEVAKKPGRKDVQPAEQKVLVKTPPKVQAVQNQPATATRNAGVVKPTLNPNLASQKRGAVATHTQGTGARGCTPKSRVNPYSISRANFNKMPKDRQQYVLSHQDKYTIVD